jgi:hypothetical protein
LYTDEQLAQAGANLAKALKGLGDRIEAVENRPAVEKLNQEWREGRRYAKGRGYDDRDLERLEGWMVQNAVGRHDLAVQLDPAPPEQRGMPLGGIPADEIELLMTGDPAKMDQAFRLALPRGTSEE